MAVKSGGPITGGHPTAKKWGSGPPPPTRIAATARYSVINPYTSQATQFIFQHGKGAPKRHAAQSKNTTRVENEFPQYIKIHEKVTARVIHQYHKQSKPVYVNVISCSKHPTTLSSSRVHVGTPTTGPCTPSQHAKLHENRLSLRGEITVTDRHQTQCARQTD